MRIIEVLNGEVLELARHKEDEGGVFVRVKLTDGQGAHNNVYVRADLAKGLALGTPVRLLLEVKE